LIYAHHKIKYAQECQTILSILTAAGKAVSLRELMEKTGYGWYRLHQRLTMLEKEGQIATFKLRLGKGFMTNFYTKI
jgi:hypothetical protein